MVITRAFTIWALKIWNTVPLEIQRSSTVLLLKKKPKTFFFKSKFYRIFNVLDSSFLGILLVFSL